MARDHDSEHERIDLPVVFTATLRRRAAAVAGAIALVVTGALLTRIEDTTPRGDPKIAGWLAIVCGLVLLAAFVRRLLRPARVRVTSEGFEHDAWHFAASRFAEWQDVTAIEVEPRGRYLTVGRSGGKSVSIGRVALSTPLEEVAHTMRLARIQWEFEPGR